EQALEFGDLGALLAVDDVEGLEVVFDVDAEPCPRLALVRRRYLRGVPREVANVPDRRLHDEVAAEETRDRPRLGGRLHDHERLGHRQTRLGRTDRQCQTAAPGEAAV